MTPKEEMEAKLFGSLDTLEHKTMDEYIRSSKLHRKVLERHLNKTGVYRSQHQLLLYIYCHPGVSQRELAGLHNTSAATVAVSLKKLEKGAYIERLVDQDDNRINQITVTNKGREVVEKSISFFRMVETRMFDGFSQEELAQLYGYVHRIRENLIQMLGEAESEEQNS